MKTLLRKIFIDNWQRKIISGVLAVIIWFIVNQSLTATRTLSNVPVRIVNIPPGKTILDLQNNGLLTKRATLTLVGNKTILEDITSNDLEVVVDASKQGDVVTITKRNLMSLNPEIDLSKGLSRVSAPSLMIRLTKLVTEKIPVIITQPIGEAPRDYQFLDIWPYQLSVTVSGPEEVVKRLKAKGLRLTLNLSDISQGQLDVLQTNPDSKGGDEVSFFVPDQWKRVSIPLISDTPIEIDDPKAKDLRVDFVRVSLIPLKNSLSIASFFPPEYSHLLNPETVNLVSTPLVKNDHGLNLLDIPLYAKGVSRLFAQIVEEMIQVAVIVEPLSERRVLDWSIQFMNPRLLEDRYVSALMSDVSDEEVRELQPTLREEYLRNRFRSYMSRFQLYKADDQKLELSISLEDSGIHIREGSMPLPTSHFLKNPNPKTTPASP